MAVNYQSRQVKRVIPRSLTGEKIIPHSLDSLCLTAWAHCLVKIMVLKLIR